MKAVLVRIYSELHGRDSYASNLNFQPVNNNLIDFIIITLDQSKVGSFSKALMINVVPSKVTTALGLQEWSTTEAAR